MRKNAKSLADRFCEFLVREKIITWLQKKLVLRTMKAWGGSFGQTLIRLDFLEQEGMLNLLSEHFDVPWVDLTQVATDPEAARKIPERLARKYKAVIISCEGGKARVAMADPTNPFVYDDYHFITGWEIVPLLGVEADIMEAIETWCEPEPSDRKPSVCF